MKLIIAGGRNFNDYELLELEVILFLSDYNATKTIEDSTLISVDYIISGGAMGADKLGERFAKEWSLPLVIKKADWNTHGKSAGPIRNNQMADICSHAIIFWDGLSRGSKSMIDICIQRNIPHKVIKY